MLRHIIESLECINTAPVSVVSSRIIGTLQKCGYKLLYKINIIHNYWIPPHKQFHTKNFLATHSYEKLLEHGNIFSS